jgi:hypothetical protein
MLMAIHPDFDAVIRGILEGDSLGEVMMLYEGQQEVSALKESNGRSLCGGALGCSSWHVTVKEEGHHRLFHKTAAELLMVL